MTLSLSEEIDCLREIEATKSLLKFTEFTWPEYQANWHHEVVCDYLDKFIKGEILRLMIEIPPQHGKSELISKRATSMMLGLDPTIKIINTGYNDTYISRFNIESQNIIESPEYRQLFPETTIKGKYQKYDGKWERNVDKFDICGYGGYYKTVGVGGSLTSFTADVALIDDVFKDYEEARSFNRRELIWNWYTTVLTTRMHSKSRLGMVMTRWHEDDLFGRIRELMKNGLGSSENFVILTLRAIKEDGDNFEYDIREIGQPLWPARFSLDFLEQKKFTSEKNFNSLYQQRPSSEEGGIFKRSYFNDSYLSLPDNSEFETFCFSWDMTFKDAKSSDYVVGQLWAKKGANFFLIDQIRDKMDFPTTLEAFKSFCAKYPHVITKLIEDKANGPGIISMLKSSVYGIIEINPKDSKDSRASAISPLFKAGNIKLPARERHPWIEAYKEELISFPDGKHDDQVDATTQALLYLCGGNKNGVTEIIW